MNLCKDCRWWDDKRKVFGTPMQVPKVLYDDSKETVSIGVCRRHAPMGDIPHTREDDWCGEFEPKEETK